MKFLNEIGKLPITIDPKCLEAGTKACHELIGGVVHHSVHARIAETVIRAVIDIGAVVPIKTYNELLDDAADMEHRLESVKAAKVV